MNPSQEPECGCKYGKTPRVMEVIVSETLRGEGTQENMFRKVTQYTCIHGTPLAEIDPAKP